MAKGKKQNLKQLGIGLLVMGCIMVFAVVMVLIQMQGDKKVQEGCTESTEGVIVRVERQKRTTTSTQKRRKRTYYVYLTEYTYSVGGTEMNFTTEVSDDMNEPHEGEKLEVHYNPDDPSVHYTPIDELKQTDTVVTASVLGPVGLALVIFGIKLRRGGIAALGMSDGNASGGNDDGFTMLN